MAGSTRKEIFDALTGSSRDGCDPDWCIEVLEKASPQDRRVVEEALKNGVTEEEAAHRLDILD